MISAHALADLLDLPAPTGEQATVIEAPLEPALVIAGAGSGKTETMAGRVLFLVANGLVRPEAVLGLTFTRKAASGLSARIRKRLRTLATRPMFRDLLQDGGEPEVLTYHALGGRLISEFGPLLGVEPRGRVLTPTAAWQIARRVVARWDADLDTDLRAEQVTEQLLAVAGSLADHLVTPGRFAAEIDALITTMRDAPPGPKQRNAVHSDLAGPLRRLSDRSAIAALVEAYQEAKTAIGAIDFGDQMQLAARLATELPVVSDALRDRFRIVLLDEYQDTGHAQRVILRALFGRHPEREADGAGWGHPVTAVGDPIQSIYGWRGASAANLPRFPSDFPRSDGSPSALLNLATSFRNDRSVLDLANRMSAPLRAGTVPVPDLRPRPGADEGRVTVALYGSVEEEDAALADAIARRWASAAERNESPPTTAVLVRRRRDMEETAAALRARGLPVEVVGLGGLLAEPEVADVVAMLRLVVDPTAGDAALRLLSGSRWQLGLADLEALSQRAKELTATVPPTQDADQDRGVAMVRSALRTASSLEDVDVVSLIDAVADPGPVERYSPAGGARLRRLGEELRRLRGRLGQPLGDLVADIERTTDLDIEVAVHGPAGRAHLDKFGDVVAEVAAGGAGPAELLDYLATAEEREDGLEPGETEPSPGRIQILTVHAAKGLEWEIVAVPQISGTVFPSSQARSWLGDPTQLPPSLRGDRSDIPELRIPTGADQSALAAALGQHTEELKRAGQAEEQRLLYVALTRAEHVLLLSGHSWGRTGLTPRGPSTFLRDIRDSAPEIAGAEVTTWAPDPLRGEPNPLTANPRRALWPSDPLGDKRARVAAGAERVRRAMNEDSAQSPAPSDSGSNRTPNSSPNRSPNRTPNSSPNSSPEGNPHSGSGQDAADGADPFNWARDVEALLRERHTASHTVHEVRLPDGVSVTALVEMATDPERLARRLRRPVPAPPTTQARRGTRFHAWLERFFAGEPLLDINELPGASDSAVVDEEVELLRARFLSSRWAARSPAEIELPFTTSISGVTVRGRVDAVFGDSDGGCTVVDWKTGSAPRSDRSAAVAVQLAVYRLAVADILGLSLDLVRAGFHYVAQDRWAAPVDLLDGAGLARLIATGRLPAAGRQTHEDALTDMARSSS